MDKEEKNRWQREYRKKTGNASTKKYEKTRRGFLMRAYRNMQSRVTGVQYKKAHLYEGKSLLDREEFYKWSRGCEEFNRLFCEWEESGHERRLCPSVDRIDSSKGYTLDNMQWISFSENCRRGSISKHQNSRTVMANRGAA